MNVRFDPFEALERTTHSEIANLNSGPAKAANPAKVLPTLATLAGGKSESEGADVGKPISTQPQWTPQDWLDHYHERAAIIEHDGELPRPEAERQAFADTVDHWLTQHPPEPTDDTTGCVHCGADLGDVAVPVLAGDRGHVWLHSACHPPWLAGRRRHAAEALQTLGIFAASARRSSGC